MAHAMPHITAAELKLMKVLWEIESGTVRDVLSGLPTEEEDAPAYTTVMTLMNQLASKNALEVDKSRQPFVYRPAVRREQILGDRLTQFLQTVFDGQAGELVLRLVGEENISPADLKRIEEKIEALERKDGTGDVSDSGKRKRRKR